MFTNEMLYAVYETLRNVVPRRYYIRGHHRVGSTKEKQQQPDNNVIRIQQKGKNYYWEVTVKETLVYLTFRPRNEATHSFILVELCDPNSLDHLCVKMLRLLDGKDERRINATPFVSQIDAILAEPAHSPDKIVEKTFRMRVLIEDALGRLHWDN